MKKRIFFYALVAMSLFACAKNETLAPSGATDGTTPAGFSFQAQWEADEAPAPKTTIGLNESNKPQTFWESGDQITVFSEAENDGTKAWSRIFTTTETGPSAKFERSDDFTPGDKYLAVYPAIAEGATKTVNFTSWQSVQWALPHQQTLPAAGGYDKSAAYAIAYTTTGSTALQFKNVCSMIKFQIADEGVRSGRITVDDADYISGDKLRLQNVTDGKGPNLRNYNNNTVYNYVDFSSDAATLSPGTVYYVAVNSTPTESGTQLTSGFQIYLEDLPVPVKSFTNEQISAFERNKIYNVGTLSLLSTDALVLDFDFTDDTLWSDWPTGGQPAGYDVNDDYICHTYCRGTSYEFVSKNPINASGATFPYRRTSKDIAWAAYRLIGLPKIEGYKLAIVKITVKSIASGGTSWAFGITPTVSTGSTAPTTYVSGGEKVTFTLSEVKTHTFYLSGTEDNTRYYIWNGVSKSVFVNGLKLIYAKVN